MFYLDPWFWAFLAAFGWFLGLLVVGSKILGKYRLFGIVCFILGQVPRCILPLPFVVQPRVNVEQGILTAAGVLVLAATLPFTVAVFRIVPWTKPNRQEPLRTDGLYSVVRHPLMFRDSFWPLGWSLIFGSVIGALLTPVWFVICWLLSILEEEKLVDEYGEQYKHYQEKTPRLIPFFRLL